VLIVALSLFGAWDLFHRAREARTSAARAALAVRLLVPAVLGGLFGFLYAGAPDPQLASVALLGLGIVRLVLCVVGGARTGSFEAAGAMLFFFAVAASLGSLGSLGSVGFAIRSRVTARP
jgi:hypothetical protein